MAAPDAGPGSADWWAAADLPGCRYPAQRGALEEQDKPQRFQFWVEQLRVQTLFLK